MSETETEKIPGKVIAAIIATGILSLCGVLVETSMNIAFPTLMREFSVSTSTVQWMTSIYLLIIAIIVPLSAVLKARFKTKTLFLTANLLFIAGLLIDAFAIGFPMLLVGRAVQGIGTGIALPLMFNIIMEQVPQQKLGMMMGFGNLITGIAPAIGPTLGGIIISALGWRWIFYLLLPLLLISLALGSWGIQQKSKLRQVSFDLLSCLLITLTFTGLVTGFANLANAGLVGLTGGGMILLGLIGMGLFAWRSLTIEQPILQLALFKNYHFAGQVLMFFCIQLCSLGFAFLLTNYIQLTNGNTALIAGLVVMPAGILGAICAPLGGRLLDAWGPRRPILTGTSVVFLSILIFYLLGTQIDNWVIAIVYSLYMMGMGSCMGAVMTSALGSLPAAAAPQGNAILNTLQQFAGSMGTSLAAMIVASAQSGRGTRSMTTAIGTHHAFLFLLVVAIIINLAGWICIPQRLQSK
ncbi:MAG: MFS transporter [Lactobacillus sp.]|jgi:EmrB/QacA subfamily drug resistance transporter|nr:MFS transporter [Lactobacillus sp.]MCH4068136.1 MFS transporter [Lactobacillus sp.]MCI1304317.1 MFS transporter [Lactobacillus sp.]MCI1330066.1 MFS transporter [Lactobacillus sp.]MCI1359843.1 MFS transporter [Lactobacillus sp.]